MVGFPRAGRRLLFVGLLFTGLSGLAGCDRNSAPSAGVIDTRPAPVSTGVTATDAPAVEKVEVPEVRVRNEGETTVRVTWITPKGTAVNDEAPFRVRWNRSDGLVEAPNDVKSTGSAVKDGFKVKVRPMPGVPNATLDGEISIVVCDDASHSVCVPVRRAASLGFLAAKDADEETTVSIPLPAAK